MKPVLLFFCFFVIRCTAAAQTDVKTIQEIETVCTYYLDGGTNGDSLMFAKAFLPQGQLLFMRNDTLRIISLAEFTARVKNTGQKQKRSTRIESIQVFGDAAVAKLTIEYDTFYFHDIMSLLKTEQGWKIVSKIFYREMKPAK